MHKRSHRLSLSLSAGKHSGVRWCVAGTGRIAAVLAVLTLADPCRAQHHPEGLASVRQGGAAIDAELSTLDRFLKRRLTFVATVDTPSWLFRTSEEEEEETMHSFTGAPGFTGRLGFGWLAGNRVVLRVSKLGDNDVLPGGMLWGFEFARAAWSRLEPDDAHPSVAGQWKAPGEVAWLFGISPLIITTRNEQGGALAMRGGGHYYVTDYLAIEAAAEPTAYIAWPNQRLGMIVNVSFGLVVQPGWP